MSCLLTLSCHWPARSHLTMLAELLPNPSVIPFYVLFCSSMQSASATIAQRVALNNCYKEFGRHVQLLRAPFSLNELLQVWRGPRLTIINNMSPMPNNNCIDIFLVVACGTFNVFESDNSRRLRLFPGPSRRKSGKCQESFGICFVHTRSMFQVCEVQNGASELGMAKLGPWR